MGVTLTAIEQFFGKHGVSAANWSQGPNDSAPGALQGMESYQGGAGRLTIDVIGNPADETQLSVDYAIAASGDAKKANALVLAVVQHFAPGAVAWIRGGLSADDGSNGYFAGAGADDTSGKVALSFATGEGKDKGLLLILAGGKIA